jgi:excisionase family DNA binding protein
MNDEIERKNLEVLWTVEQVATYFSIRKSTVYQWISDGKMIDPAKLVYVGKLVRIPRSEVERIASMKKTRIAKVPTPAKAVPAKAVPIR